MRLCWFYKRAASWVLDSQEPVPAWLQRHLDACPDCRRFHLVHVEIASALAAGASGQVTEPPPFLRTRILSALHSEMSRQERYPSFRWIPAMLVPICGVFLFVVYLVSKPPASHPFMPASVPPAMSLPDAVSTLIPQPDPAQLLTWAESADLPLQTELNSVVSDARFAFQSLAMNFLPDSHTTRFHQEPIRNP